MASAAAQRYFNSFSPDQQSQIRQSWGGADRMDEWFQNAVSAGAIGPDGTMGSRKGSFGGDYSVEAGQAARQEGFSTNVTGASGLKPGMTPSPGQLRQFAKENNWSEDFNRFSDAQLQAWINSSWDPQAQKFHSEHGGALVEKPVDVGEGETASWARGGGGGGGGGSYSSGSSYGGGTAGAAPTFTAPKFTAPGYEDVINDPGFQARLKTGQQLLQNSQAAKGMVRTGGSLADLLQFGQDYASNEYGNAYNRAANTFGLNYQGAKDEFAPQYGAWQTQYGGDLSRWTTGQNNDLSRWQTQYGGDLSKYLQRESQIYGALNQPAPTW